MVAAEGRIAELTRRGIVAVGGADRKVFVNDLITSEVAGLASGEARYGALLSPQGKILFDFLVVDDGERYLFDLPAQLAADFAKRLGFYKLRAKVEVAALPGERVLAAWEGESPTLPGVVFRDPRLPALGFRAIVPNATEASAAGFVPGSEADYDAHRIALGVPEGNIDFAFGDTFPHDADMDQLGGVDFRKGCYVGQEVVSRMEHRGTARRRIIRAEGDGLTPGAEIVADGRPLGTLGSVAEHGGLALVRLDRAKDAIDAGKSITADGRPIALALPAWAGFTWPAPAGGEE